MKGEKGAPSLEYPDPAQGGPVIRVLYASHTLPIFDGKPHALIDPACDRQVLWGGIIEQIRDGVYDQEIEAVAKKVAASLEKKRTALKAAPGR